MTTQQFIFNFCIVRKAQNEVLNGLLCWLVVGAVVGFGVFPMQYLDKLWLLPFTTLWLLSGLVFSLFQIRKQFGLIGLMPLHACLMIGGPTYMLALAEGLHLLFPYSNDWILWTLPYLLVWCIACTAASVFEARNMRQTWKRLGFLCPHCHAKLLTMKAVLIATGNCGRCGEQVFEESESLPEQENPRFPDSDQVVWKFALILLLFMAGMVQAVRITTPSVPPVAAPTLAAAITPSSTPARPFPGYNGPLGPVPHFKPSNFFSISLDSTFPETKQTLDHRRPRFGEVAQQVVRVMDTMFAGRKPADRRPIVISQKKIRYTATTDWRSDPKRIHIYFIESPRRTEGRHHASFAWSLSRELARIILDPRRDSVLADVLTEAIASETCDRLTSCYPRWGLPAEWREYGPSYKLTSDYYNERQLERFRPEILQKVRSGSWDELTCYLSKNQALRDVGLTPSRKWLILEALTLRSGPVPWPELVGLGGRAHPSPQQDPAQRWLPVDLHGISPGLDTALQRIGRGRTTAQTKAN